MRLRTSLFQEARQPTKIGARGSQLADRLEIYRALRLVPDTQRSEVG